MNNHEIMHVTFKGAVKMELYAMPRGETKEHNAVNIVGNFESLDYLCLRLEQ